MPEQPNASTQYKDWKKFPDTYAEPKHEDWIAEIAEKDASIAHLQQELEDAAGRFLCLPCYATDGNPDDYYHPGGQDFKNYAAVNR